jgi:RHS repeat-associated protein
MREEAIRGEGGTMLARMGAALLTARFAFRRLVRICAPRPFSGLGLVLGLLVGLSASQASAASPTVKIGTGTLIDPATALSIYNNPVSPAAPTTRDPLVQELARSLSYNIDRIFTHVRDHVELTPMYGLQKGARGAILDGYGTPFDQAQAFVDMLRESDAVAGTGYNPHYVLGRITLQASDFAAWFGVSDADAARHVLADGGFPASVTGAGGSFTVVMSHVWVAATVSGQTYVFDPSYKPHTVTPAINFATAMQYNSATLLSSGTTGSSTDGASYISGFNTSALQSTLTGYRANLEAYLNTPANGLVGARADNVVGHRSITPHPATDNRRTALPYATTSDATWAGQIPNPYRTSFSVMLTGWSAPDVWYADEVYGKPLLYSYPSTQSPYQGVSGAAIVPTLHLQTGVPEGTCDWYSDSQSASPTIMTIQINHPYVTASGAPYMSRTLTKQLSWRSCGGSSFTANGRVVVTNDWGDISPKVVAMMRQAEEPRNYFTSSYNQGNSDFPVGPQLESVASQYSAYARLAGQALGGVYQLHDLIGVASLDRVNEELTSCCSGGGSATIPSAGLMLTMDFEAGVSANPGAGVSPAARAGLVRLAQSGLAAAESGVARQESDGVRDTTSLTLLTQNPGSLGGTYYLANSGNWGSISGALTGYSTTARSILSGYIGEGYSLLLPANGALAQPSYTFTQSGQTRTSLLLDTAAISGFASRTVLYRPAFFAFNPTTGDGAYLIYDPRRQRTVKGGNDVTVQDPSQSIVSKPDTPQPTSKDLVESELSVHGQTGVLNYAPPVDLVDGAGSFPRSLSVQRRYDPTDTNDYGLGVGWKTNWRQSVTLNNDGQAALGGSGAFGAASALVAIKAVSDLASNPDDPAHLLAEAAAQQWFVSQTINNVATVTQGVDPDETFLSTAAGGFQESQPDGAQLTQTGQPSDSLINRRIYVQSSNSSVGFTYVGREGDTRTYSYVINPGMINAWEPAYLGNMSRKLFALQNWSFPTGDTVSLSYYNYNPLIVSNVSNELGRSLTLQIVFGDVYNDSCAGGVGGTVVSNPVAGWATYTSSANATVRYGRTPYSGLQVFTCTPEPGVASYYMYGFRPVETDFTDAVGKKWSYTYAPLTTVYDDSNGVADAGNGSYTQQLVSLGAIYRPSAPATAAATVSYGVVDGEVRTITDALGAQRTYQASPFFTQTTFPLTAATSSAPATFAINTAAYDEYGRDVVDVDPLGRTSAKQYDNRDRLILEATPSLGCTAYGYDVRGNRIATAQFAAGFGYCSLNGQVLTGPIAPTYPTASSSNELTTFATYGEGASVLNCVNPVTCNKPASDFDPNNNQTQYFWDPTSGALTKILKPSVAAGQPETDFNYTATAIGGANVRFLSSKVDKITSSLSTTTTYSYNSSNKYVLASVTADNGGLNLTTNYMFDTAGDLTAVQAPRTDGVTSTTTYVWRSDRRLQFVIAPATTQNGVSQGSVAIQYLYNDDGDLKEIDKGVTTNSTGSDFAAQETTLFAYDLDGRVIQAQVLNGTSMTAPPLKLSQTTYDLDDRATCSVVRMNTNDFGALAATPVSGSTAASALPTDACTPDSAVNQQIGMDRITRTNYDLAGEVTSSERAVGDQQYHQTYESYCNPPGTSNCYTVDGKVQYITDAIGNLTTYTYDGFDRLIQTTFPSTSRAAGASDAGDFEQYYYDYNGNRTNLIKRDRTTNLGFTYDALNEETVKTAPGYTVRTQYDLLGRKTSTAFDSGFGVTYQWDNAGRLTQETTGNQTLQYRYDDGVNRTQITWPDLAFATYAYDAASRVQAICQGVALASCHAAGQSNCTTGAGLLAAYCYDTLGRRSSISRNAGSGASTAYGYDSADQLVSLSQAFPGAANDNQSYSYGYNPAGQVFSTSSPSGPFAWTNHPWASNGNSYDGLNRDASIAALSPAPSACGGTGGYDCNGNLLNSGRAAFAYDAENRLISATVPSAGITETLAYDPLGRLNQTSTTTGGTTQFLYSGNNLVAEYQGTTLQHRYIPGPRTDESIAAYDASGNLSWFIADRQGSIIAQADGSGIVLNTYSYGPYGEPQAWGGSRFAYTGQIQLSEASLYHYKARAYDPASGRFLQTDPVGYLDDADLYAYVAEDPIDKSDPSGDDGTTAVPDSPFFVVPQALPGTRENQQYGRDAWEDYEYIQRGDAARDLGRSFRQLEESLKRVAWRLIRDELSGEDDLDQSDPNLIRTHASEQNAPVISNKKGAQDPGAGRQGGARAGGKPHKGKPSKHTHNKHTKPRSGSKTKQRDKDGWFQR